MNVFFRDGERKNRKKNRLKFLLRKIGEAEFIRRIDEEFERIKAERGEALAADAARYTADFHETEPRPSSPGAMVSAMPRSPAGSARTPWRRSRRATASSR